MIAIVSFLYMESQLHNPALSLMLSLFIYLGVRLIINSYVSSDEEWSDDVRGLLNDLEIIKSKLKNFKNKKSR